ncbi:MAG: type II toxin-antitoxin system mRNA interferase toxin, RelE/StbE family [Candidatus Sungbacteria bacterium]|uniref:Type II toxin-antitoxin system mRNA interferase toxin, RelE/StbE family n=1 Tax=Candidatus Sungiibacteriota bacterium TaxID=2750080 RepID=A0A9D6LNB0_9BACT|nr:type II toxin-antitoxin system mRNA interferase toxin, RelE/StbE family [Candidatus Sungbacteria bacterium]
MKVLFHKNFDKNYQKLPVSVRNKFKKRLRLFMADPFNPTLNNHALHGEWRDFRSINVTGDFRAFYKTLDETTVEFTIIDKHSNLYS